MDKPEGIIRKLADPNKPQVEPVEIHERNALKILANSYGAIQIEGEDAQLADIKKKVKDHIDNGGGRAGNDDQGPTCDYCRGKRDKSSSDHPKDAVVSVELDRGTPYRIYITVQNEIDKAVNELRDRYSTDKYGMPYAEIKKLASKEDKATPGEFSKKKTELETEIFPAIVAESKPKDNSK